ncbi:hypothetical protein I552_5656 [Mycobacterium xenopi 3993]|nr:hypothetical protein I552_5656 [Mycobacterium xenopi 3993]
MEMLSPTLSSTGASISPGSGESSGRLDTLGPFTGSTLRASSFGNGGTNIAVLIELCSGRSSFG